MSMRTGLSLSFLDLVTCGFGGVTLVFLILLAVQGRLSDPKSTASPGEEGRPTSPFVIWVESLAAPAADGSVDASPLWRDAAVDPWTVEKGSPGTFRTGFGPRQAVYVASEPPPEGVKILLGPFADPNARFRASVARRGRTTRSDLQSTPTRPKVQVWPMASSSVDEAGEP